jgi:hypothetical protein
MNIHHLKKVLFSVSECKKDSNCQTLVHTNRRWLHLTPPLKVRYSTVNNFESDHHKLTLDCREEWLANITAELKEAARTIIEPKHFDQYWKQCHKPTPVMSIETYAYTKRGHNKIFINMFNDVTNEEITGKEILGQNAMVKLYLSWRLVRSDLDGYIQYGWRPFLGRGIRICTLTSEPYIFKRPWDWSILNFVDNNVPMHSSFIVKTPALRVLLSENNVVTTADDLIFDDKMKEFHRLSGCRPWNNRIHIHKSVSHHQLLLASIYPIRNKDEISWHTLKIVVRRAPSLPKQAVVEETLRKVEVAAAEEVKVVAVGAEEVKVVAVGAEEVKAAEEGVGRGKKRERKDHGNMDNSFDVKTKRKCNRDDNDDHN